MKKVFEYGALITKIGKYDAMLTNSYSEVSAEMYVNRFCFKIRKYFQFVKRAIKQLDKMRLKTGSILLLWQFLLSI